MSILFQKGLKLIPATVDALPIEASVSGSGSEFVAKIEVNGALLASKSLATQAAADTQAALYISKMVARLSDGGVTIIVIDDSDF